MDTPIVLAALPFQFRFTPKKQLFRSGARYAFIASKKIVALILAALAVASGFFVSSYEIFWPLAIILGGIYLLYTALRRPTAV